MRILAIDYGDVRTGLAVCDKKEFLASPLKVIRQKNADILADQIAEVVKQENIDHIILGLPKNMDSSLGFRAQKSLDLAEKLREILSIEVELWDERLTTVSAIEALNATNVRGEKRKNVIDAVAATIMLQDYLDYRKNSGLF
ncbi:MAG TPA: Holliday junction resolvase RuvX [Clostridiales bacterium]|jgi:putative Holliday junction resolvase|nr:Holliday junction resolvase RuvX [Clostridiales bacterium]